MSAAYTDSVYRTELPRLAARGKVRDVYDLGERLMIVATDRISAFDVVMDEPVPGKGAILTSLSAFWLSRLPACGPHHLEYVVDDGRVPPGYEPYLDQLRGRAMVVRKAVVLPIEFVVRGYLIGGGWKEYRECGSVSGVRLPAGLRQAERLPEPILTPSTKAERGHDEPVSFEQACALARERLGGGDRVDAAMHAARRRALDIYRQAAEHASARGVILADTKFEFGLVGGRSPGGSFEPGELTLIDEVLTPDSSRFWPADEYVVGSNPPSFDKQYLRDYLESVGWDKRPPPPAVPDEVIEQTRQRYEQARRMLMD